MQDIKPAAQKLYDLRRLLSGFPYARGSNRVQHKKTRETALKKGHVLHLKEMAILDLFKDADTAFSESRAVCSKKKATAA